MSTLPAGIPLPSPRVALTLASIAVHADEATSDGASRFDLAAIRGLLEDPALGEYLKELDALALIPKKRA